MLGASQNSRPADGPPYLTLSYITNTTQNTTKNNPVISIDPIQNINDQVFSIVEVETNLSDILYGGTSFNIPIYGFQLDNNIDNVISIYRKSDVQRVENIIGPGKMSVIDVSGFPGYRENLGDVYNSLVTINGDISNHTDLRLLSGTKVVVTINAKIASNPKMGNELTLDFSYLAAQNFGFGVEKYSIQGNTRKNIQQTHGDFVGDNVYNNFFVDTWGLAPDKIILSGVIEIPHGLDFACRFKDGTLIQNGRQVNPTENSFIGTIEEFYRNNNNPTRVNNGEILTLNDYYSGEFYIVTFKSRSFDQNIGRPNLIPWQIELIVLGKTTVSAFKNESLSNKGIANQFLNFGI